MNLIRRTCVVLVIDDLGYGGAERQVVELANNLDATRFDVHVCALSKHVPLSRLLTEAERRLHIVKMINRFDFTLVLRLAHLLQTLRADIVQAYQFKAEVLCRLAARLAGTPLVIGGERNADRAIRRWEYLGLKLTHRFVDVIIANSKAGAESNSKVFRRPSSDYRVVHNGVDTERFRPTNGDKTRQKLGIPLRCPVVGAFANFKKQKNHAVLFRAFKLVLEHLADARLLLVGDKPADSRGKLDGYKAQLDRLVDELGIRQQCVFLGHCEDIEYLYPACDVTVLSSLHEGTPNVLLESMACGVPVVATNVCDNEYIVRDGEVGYLVAVGDEAEMAHRIQTLLCDNLLRQKMGQKARAWVQEEFSTKRLAEKMESVYVELLDRKRT